MFGRYKIICQILPQEKKGFKLGRRKGWQPGGRNDPNKACIYE
jgi:hypothetical protein